MENYRKIFLKDYEVTMLIGVNEDELESPQKVLINVELYVSDPKREINDDFENVLNYDLVRDEIDRIVESGHINLQETLVDRIVEVCFSFNDVEAVKVSSEKLEAYSNCVSAGFEVFRKR